MKRILLTGGKGFFASRLAAYYRHQYEIYAPGRKELNITDKASVAQVLEDFRPEIVIHTAAAAETAWCNAHPDLAHAINVEATLQLAEAAKKNKAKLVFISTEQVFNGRQEPGPFSEEDTPLPNTVYGANKLLAEQELQNILGELWIVRFTWLFGMPERNCSMSNVILWEVLTKLWRQEPLVASKREFRGMTDVYEIIEQFPKLWELPYGTYHLGAENPLSRYEVVAGILRELGVAAKVEALLLEDTLQYQDKPRDVRLNTAKAQSFGFTFTPTLEALQKCLKTYGLSKDTK